VDTWNELKSKGSEHYKTGGTEPVDLYAAGNMFHDFALCSIMKYAFRSRREMNLETDLLIKNLEKIIDYAQKLIAGLKTTKRKKENLFEKHKRIKKSEVEVFSTLQVFKNDANVAEQLKDITEGKEIA
jgi:hypothetical protein